MKDRSKTKWGLITCAFLVATGLCASTVAAQTMPATTQYDAASRVFRLDAADSTYVLGINQNSQLQTLYWGKRLSANDPFPAAKAMPGGGFDLSTSNTPQEFVSWGGGLTVEPDLKITFPDGNRDVVLKYVSHHIEGNTLSVVMKDISREVYVTLEYQPDAETVILRRSATIENRTGAPFTIEQVASGTWNLPRGTDYRLRYLTGRWAAEWNVQEQPIQPGKIVLESRRGSTGAQNNPWFAIDYSGNNEPEQGGVWFGALGWSGSWQITV